MISSSLQTHFLMTAFCLLWAVPQWRWFMLIIINYSLFLASICTPEDCVPDEDGGPEWSRAAAAIPWALERETCLLRTGGSLWLNSLRQWRNPSSHETNLERSYFFFSFFFFLLLGSVLRSQPGFSWCTLSIVHNGRLRWLWQSIMGWWGKTGLHFCLFSIVAVTRPPQCAPCTSAGVLSGASFCRSLKKMAARWFAALALWKHFLPVARRCIFRKWISAIAIFYRYKLPGLHWIEQQTATSCEVKSSNEAGL